MTVPTGSTGDGRVRRPLQHEDLLRELHDEAGFPYMRDSLLFAAALGANIGRRTPFKDTGESIRYETLTDPMFASALVNMIATRARPEDPEILDSGRLQERLDIFAEYANGGLDYIQEQRNVRHQPLDQVVANLVSEALDSSRGDTGASLEDLLGGVSWSR